MKEGWSGAIPYFSLKPNARYNKGFVLGRLGMQTLGMQTH